MTKKARLGIYLDDEGLKRQIKVASAKRGMTVTNYCVEAIEERLVRDGEISAAKCRFGKANGGKLALLDQMDKLRQEIGPIGIRTSQLVKEGRRR